ncbi:hypothetical protein Shyhy01_67310 [Streptomyces hygroscopicus subsp. hygroscopicus]|nr:hypothetical protein Shyhy01_67310 [Streptomyces hygroscopicus subsp. hygroscopicus]
MRGGGRGERGGDRGSRAQAGQGQGRQRGEERLVHVGVPSYDGGDRREFRSPAVLSCAFSAQGGDGNKKPDRVVGVSLCDACDQLA